jgi:hypothetical protein
MPLARATFSIDKTTLERFNRSFPSGERSRVVQRMLERVLDEQEKRLRDAASLVETDPAFATLHDDAALWGDATGADGLSER